MAIHWSLVLAAVAAVAASAAAAAPTMDSLRVALVQYPLTGQLDLASLAAKARQYITEAAVHGAQLVMLPELFVMDLLDLSVPELPQMDAVVDALSPCFLLELQKMARDQSVYVLAGSLPTRLASGKVRNRS